MAEESSNECTPLDLSMKAKATPSTAHDGTQGASSTLGAYRTISDDALRYPRNTQHTPTTKEICNVDGVTDNGDTRYQQMDSIRSINNVRPSTCHAGMEEASAKSEDGATYVDEYINDVWEVLNSQTDATDVNDATDSGSTSLAPVESSASADHSMPSTSHAGIEKVSSTTENTTRLYEDAWRYQGYTQTTVITEDTCNVDGVADNGNTSYLHLGPISSIDNPRPRASRAGMKDAAASFEDGATYATGTGEREQQASCATSRKVSSTRDASHGQPNKHTGDTAPTFRARNQSSVKKSSHKCETCGKFLSGALSLTEHYRMHTGERPFKCEICKKSFSHRASFHKHKQIHTGVKPYICQICTKPFRNKEDLKSHPKSHSSDRPFVCDICNRPFKWKTNIRRHRKRAH